MSTIIQDMEPKVFAFPANRGLQTLRASDRFSNGEHIGRVTPELQRQTNQELSIHLIADAFFAAAHQRNRNDQPFYSTTPDSSDEPEIILKHKPKRELTLEKPAGEYFGAEVAFVGGRLFVVWVDKYGDNRNSTALSAAFRAGLGFGDEITRINTSNVKTFGNSVSSMYTFLDSLDKIYLEVVDKTVFTHHVLTFNNTEGIRSSSQSTLTTEGEETVGLSFAQNGTITRVVEGGLGFLAGLQEGEKIVRIGNMHTLNTHPRGLARLFARAKKSSKTSSIIVSVAPARLISILANAAEAVIKTRFLSCELNYVLDHDFDLSMVGNIYQQKTSCSGIQLMPVASVQRNYTSHSVRNHCTQDGRTCVYGFSTQFEYRRAQGGYVGMLDV
eukprot:CFRG1471T1